MRAVSHCFESWKLPVRLSRLKLRNHPAFLNNETSRRPALHVPREEGETKSSCSPDGRRGTAWARCVLLEHRSGEQIVTDRTDATIHSIRGARAYGVAIRDDGETYLKAYELSSPF